VKLAFDDRGFKRDAGYFLPGKAGRKPLEGAKKVREAPTEGTCSTKD
jgi:hypothetical protein